MVGHARPMSFARVGRGLFEVSYGSVQDMQPELQRGLLRAIEDELASGPVALLFAVNTLDVPRSVPEFWFTVTRRLAPGLCAMAIVSDSLAVRAAASAFSVTNRVRKVKLEVKAYTVAQAGEARAWCEAARSVSPLPLRGEGA